MITTIAVRMCGTGSKSRTHHLPPLALNAMSNPNLHQQFTDLFCTKLHQSGVEAFESINGCKINFTFTPDADTAVEGASSTALISETSEEASELGWSRRKKPEIIIRIGIEIQITHIVADDGGSGLVMDNAAMDKAIVDSYNEVNAGVSDHILMSSFL